MAEEKSDTEYSTHLWGTLFFLIAFTLNTLVLLGFVSCSEVIDVITVDSPNHGETVSTDYHINEFDGVDLLVVLDNSISMENEQAILATSFFKFVNALVNTPVAANWPYAAVNNLRIAVVSSDLAFSAGGEPYDHETAQVQWPHDLSGLANCWDSQMGDGAQFFGYDPSAKVIIQSGEIICDDASHCPKDWACEENKCFSPSGGPEMVDCPGSGQIFTETELNTPNSELAIQAACLSDLGTKGCGIEQQLQAGVIAFSDANSAQRNKFIKGSHLLAYLFVSDEEDCSLKDSQARDAFFQSNDIQDSKRINVSCGEQAQDYLLSPIEIKDLLVGAKQDEHAVIYAAIVGVPPVPDCQNIGFDLNACLEHPKMQYVEVEAEDGWKFDFACEREQLTQATPGRRFVHVAQKFSQQGFVYSICNADWNPAMVQLADLIAQNMKDACFTKQLVFKDDRTDCQLLVTFAGMDSCPDHFKFKDSWQLQDGTSAARCIVPQLSAPLNCAESQMPLDIFGWHYCENTQLDRCLYQINLTAMTKSELRGRTVEIECSLVE